LIDKLHKFIWAKPLQSLKDKGDPVASLCCDDLSSQRTIAWINFAMYTAFLVSIFVYVPIKYPGWLTWVLFIPEWLQAGSDAFLGPHALLFFFHIIPYSVISIGLGYVSVIPGCAIMNPPLHDNLRELNIAHDQILKSLVKITNLLIVRYLFFLMLVTALLRMVVVAIEMSNGNTMIAEYGMNPFFGVAVDITCLILMIYGKIFSSYYCSMVFPKLFHAFLLSIWMTIEYWILFAFLYILNTRLFVPLIFGSSVDAINLNRILYANWILTGVIGTLIAYHFMAKSSIYKKWNLV
jgi:hypothetical protein